MFSKSCEYALRCMLYVASESAGERRVGVKSIAAQINAPQQFIAKVLQQLVRADLLQSAKGPTGGFYLDDAHAQGNLADIVYAIDGERLLQGCVLGLQKCDATHPCPLHHDFEKIRSQISNVLKKTRISSFNNELSEELSFLKY